VKPDHPEPGRAFEGDLMVQPPALLQGGDIVHVHLKMSAVSHNGKKEGCQHDDDVHLPGSPPSAEVLEEMTRVYHARILS